MAALGDAVVLLTGASGFIGSHCRERLLQMGCRLHAVNRRGGGPGDGRIIWHAVDLRDGGAAARLIAEIQPTHLLHAAWIATPGVFWDAAENIDWLYGGTAMVRAFGEAGGRRFVGVGSCAEYDWHSGSFSEDRTPIRPATLYGKTKAAMWATATACAAQYGFSAAWGRVFLPYGPGEPAQRLIPTVVDHLRGGRPVALTEGTQTRDFIYAPDSADLFVRLLETDLDGAFNIATGRGTSVRHATEYIARRLGAEGLLHWGARHTLVDEPATLVADMAKVARVLGWHAPTAIETGLDQVLSAGRGGAA